MKTDAIDLFLKLNQARAGLQLKLDEELGTLHGLSLSDFIVLHQLSSAEGGRLAVADLVRPLGVQQSAVVRQLIPLEKTGHITRDSEPAADGKRYVAIRPAARRVLNEALATAELVCTEAFWDVSPGVLLGLDAGLSMLCDDRGASKTSFLQFMEKQMTEHPQDIVAADADQLRRIGKLVKGVDAA